MVNKKKERKKEKENYRLRQQKRLMELLTITPKHLDVSCTSLQEETSPAPLQSTKVVTRKRQGSKSKRPDVTGSIESPRRSSRVSIMSGISSGSTVSIVPIKRKMLVKSSLPKTTSEAIPMASMETPKVIDMGHILATKANLLHQDATSSVPMSDVAVVSVLATTCASSIHSGVESGRPLSDDITSQMSSESGFSAGRDDTNFLMSIEEFKLQYTIIAVDGDGNCLFSCLSHFLVGNQGQHDRVRREVVDYVCHNWATFAQDRLEIDEHQYRLEMSKDAAYGSEMEVFAFARLYTRNVMIHRLENPHTVRWNMLSIYEGGQSAYHHMLFSGMERAHYLDGHYQVVVAIDDVPECDEPSTSIEHPSGHASLCSDVSSMSLDDTVDENSSTSSLVMPGVTPTNNRRRRPSKKLTPRAQKSRRRNLAQAKALQLESLAASVQSDTDEDAADEANPSEGQAEPQEFVFAMPAARPRVPNRRPPPTYKCAMGLVGENVEAFSCCTLTARCPVPHCGAIHFEKEKKNAKGLYNTCCTLGKVQLEPLKECPELLRALLTEGDAAGNGVHFRKHIRRYNAAFQMASFNADNIVALGPGPFCFKIQGNVYHRVHCAIPLPERPRKHNQIYFVDSDRAMDCRMAMEPQCRENILRSLEVVFREVNPFCQSFVMMKDVMEREEANAEAAGIPAREIILNLVVDVNTSLRTHNLPESPSEIAVIFFADDPPFRADVQCHSLGGRPQTVSHLSGVLDPMVYPLIFPRGDYGFRLGLEHHHDYRSEKNRSVTMRQFYKFRIALRDAFSVLHSVGTLFQQYLVDAWLKTEGNELNWIQQNQTKLRRDTYVGLADHVARQAERQGTAVGMITIIPATQVNSPRFFAQNCQDAMTTMLKNGMPDYMVTVTANASWPEIKSNLAPGDTANNRPDLTVPVFQMRLESIITDLMVNKVLGHVVNYVYAIEFQKRGLPHAHIVLTMRECDKPRTGADLDLVIRSDIPDPVTEPRLFRIVTKKMIHNVCSERCWKPETRECSKKFPKPYSDETIFNVRGRAVHRRKSIAQGGRSFRKAGHDYSDADVVPYNPYLLLRHDTHINVEACVSERCFLYICQYITKGNASATVALRDVQLDGALPAPYEHNEVTTYEACRYVSPPEACYRLYEHPMFVNTDTVYRLPLHLEDHQHIVFQEEHERDAYLRATGRDTRLTGWFKANGDPGETGLLARTMTYDKFPEVFVWHTEGGLTEWRPRRRGFDHIASRLYDVSPQHVELFHMRILLTHVRGATSFAGLRTVDGVVCATYIEACILRNLLADDSEYDKCMERGGTLRGSRRLRQLYAYIVMYCQVADPPAMLERHMDKMIEDYLHKGLSQEEGRRRCLVHISAILERNCSSSEAHRLPAPGPPTEETGDALVSDIEYHLTREAALARRDQLNVQQRVVYDAAMDNVERYQCGDLGSAKLMFVDGPGGTGKTFLYNTLIANMQHLGMKVHAVAWTGIAATLLYGGQTCHRLFKIPFKLDKYSTLGITAQSEQAATLLAADLILVDEVSMAHKEAFRAIDDFMKFVTGRHDVVFGGKAMLFGGDFRQLMPVLPGAGDIAVVNASMKSSYLWPLMRKYALTENLRAGPDQQEWADWLLQVGNGTLPCPHPGLDGMVEIDASCRVTGLDMPTTIFGPGLNEDVSHCAILTPTNKTAMSINECILASLPGEMVTLYSADKLVERENATRVTQEILNGLTPSGFAPHVLNLKVGAVVMLQRNLDIEEGLCNGTRLQVVDINPSMLHCKIVSDGAYMGNDAYLPRTIQILDDTRVFAFKMERVQFPVRLSYAMTINKAQGQSFHKIGLVLDKKCFAHGQFYVAASRVSRLADFKVQVYDSLQQGRLIEDEPNRTFARNVVWHEVLDK